jgi:Secretion system C-terminal sorting domain
MKTLYYTLFFLFYVIHVNAQQKLKLPHEHLTTSLYKIKSNPQYYLDSKQKNTTQNTSSVQTIIGSTVYDFQSNASMPRRIHQYDNGKVTCIWNGSWQDSPYSDRGTFVNYFNGTQWGSSPLGRIENKITGWSSLAVTTNTEHVIAEPNIISSNNGQGTAFDTGRTFTNHTHLRGPHAAAAGQYIHIVMAANEPDTSTGFIAPIYYTRSNNAGLSFEPMTANFAAMAAYDTSVHAGNVGPNAYSIDAYQNTVAILVLGVTEDVVLLKSTNNGTTWTKTIIREFPIKKYKGGLTDKNGDGLMDTLIGVTGDGSIVIDHQGVVHVVFSDLELFSADTGEINIFPINRSDYMNYWNDEDKKFVDVPVLIDKDGNGIFDAGSNFSGDGKVRYGNSGYSFNPQLSVGAAGTSFSNFIFLNYVAVTENDTDNRGVDFRSIYFNFTSNDRQNWCNPQNFSETENVENVYPTTNRRVLNDRTIHINWQQDFEPGNAVQAQHVAGPSDIIYEAMHFSSINPCWQGINTFHKKIDVIVYPNPANNKIRIELIADIETNASIKFINILGQTIFKDFITIKSSTNSYEINSSDFDSGIYIMVIESTEGRITQKIIIE